MDNSLLINEMLSECFTSFNESELEKIKIALLKVLENYDVKIKEKSLTVYESFIPHFYQTYIVTKKMEGKSMKSLELYNFYLTKFFALMQMPVDKITADAIRLFLYRYQEQTHMSSRTLDTVRSCLSAFFSWSSAEGYLKSNPMASIRPIKYERKLRGYLDLIEVEKMRNSCIDSREKALFEFFCSTGCRVSEAINVRISDIDFDSKECDVLGKGNKHRKVYILPKCELALRTYLTESGRNISSDDFLFKTNRNTGHDHISMVMAEKIIKAIAKRAGIEKNVFPHLLRHTVATTSIQKGMSVEQVQRLLGHSSINTTSIYTHITDSDVKYDFMRRIS